MWLGEEYFGHLADVIEASFPSKSLILKIKFDTSESSYKNEPFL